MGGERGSQAFQNARLRKQQNKARRDALGEFTRAMTLHRSGLGDQAQAICREILRLIPDHLDALNYLGECEFKRGQYEIADQFLERAQIVNPDSAAVHSNRGAVLLELKRFDEALTVCEKAIALKPDYAEAHNNCGNALLELGCSAAALTCYNRAIALKPNYADAYSNRGRVLHELRQLEKALADCEQAIALKPNHAGGLTNCGNALMELRRFDEALARFDEALAKKPDLPAALLGRGNALLNLNRIDEASAAYEKALALKPDYAKAWAQFAWCHERRGDVEEAVACFDRALALKPDFAEVISNKIFVLDYASDVDFIDHQDARSHWWDQIGAKIAAASEIRRANDRDPSRRIVLGYVSADFKTHSAAYAFLPVLRNHDKSRFEIVCYSSTVAEDDLTEEFKRIADRWRNVPQLTDEELAARICADKIDILIDLSGHSAGHRLGAFACKPAPIQVTAWGNAHGTGLPTMDYLFSDPVAIPQTARDCFAEAIYDLPCLLTVERPPFDLPPSDPPMLSRGYPTFGVFNRVTKISDRAVEVWARILQSAPQSRLLMKDFFLDDESTRDVLRARFAKHDIAGGRIDFLGATPRREHLLALNGVDICLDPFPQNGGVSTWDALHMGVPVIAKLGNSVPSRVSGAILSSIGLTEWVAGDADDYVAIAVKFAAEPEHLKSLRHDLAVKISNSASGNPAGYTAAVEAAYRAMWERFCRQD